MLMKTPVMENGIKKYKTEWIPTGLDDRPENVHKASEMRWRMLESIKDGNTSGATLRSYVQMFLKIKKRKVADTTYATYQYQAKHMEDYFGDIKIKDIRKHHVEEFFDSLFEKEKMQYRSVKDIKTIMSSIMQMAVTDGMIAENIVTDIELSQNLANKVAKDKNPEEEFFSFEEALRFLKCVEDHPLYELFYVALIFGMRREEVLGLKWSAVDFDNKKLFVKHTVTKGTTINRLNVTKTAASYRYYPLTDSQVEMFRALKEKEKQYKALFGNCYTDNDYVFKQKDGTLYYPDYPTKAFSKIIKKTPNLPQSVTFHGLRKSCVSILVHNGLDVKSIQRWVGHSDIDTTLKIYAQVKEREAKNLVSEGMEELFKPVIRKDE
ncbi:MAG: site-specific integrase [Lachnospiraceae bacterium]|nr:site-specific integrase [Lachnospiraceae bacterium]